VRDANTARFRYDLSAISQSTRAMQDESERKYVCLLSRPVVSSDTKHDLNDHRRGKRISDS